MKTLKNSAAGKLRMRLCSATMRKPSLVQHTPLGTLKFRLGAKGFTSSASPSELRSVTAHTVVLRVPTKTMFVLGATAMWRASGTTANNSILKPGGSHADRPVRHP